MALTTNDLHRLADHFEKQGARIKRTRSGYQVFTDSGSLGFHLTPSDVNQERQIKRDARRCGLEMP